MMSLLNATRTFFVSVGNSNDRGTEEDLDFQNSCIQFLFGKKTWKVAWNVFHTFYSFDPSTKFNFFWNTEVLFWTVVDFGLLFSFLQTKIVTFQHSRKPIGPTAFFLWRKAHVYVYKCASACVRACVRVLVDASRQEACAPFCVPTDPSLVHALYAGVTRSKINCRNFDRSCLLKKRRNYDIAANQEIVQEGETPKTGPCVFCCVMSGVQAKKGVRTVKLWGCVNNKHNGKKRRTRSAGGGYQSSLHDKEKRLVFEFWEI